MEISKQLPIGEIIKLVASQHVGEKEIPGNRGWINKAFWELMKPFHRYGDPWCADFLCYCWYTGYTIKYGEYPKLLKEIKKLFSASSQRLIRNFQNSNLFVVNKQPSIGAGYVWAYTSNGKKTAHGHTGAAVTLIKSRELRKLSNGEEKWYYKWLGVEGNASDMVREMSRDNEAAKGKIFLGFIHPREFNAKELKRYS